MAALSQGEEAERTCKLMPRIATCSLTLLTRISVYEHADLLAAMKSQYMDFYNNIDKYKVIYINLHIVFEKKF